MSLENSLKELEQKLKERDAQIAALEKESRTKSEFLMGMGHEIRTPMNGIMGMTNLVLETELSKDQRRHLEMVNSSAERLLEVVTDILDFCRIESGTLQFNTEDFHLSDSLDCDLYLMKLSARQKNVDLDYSIASDVPEVLNSDPDRLVQVIINIVNNAIKFTEKGTITIKVEKISEGEQDVTLKFTIRDTGIGIPPEKQKIILDTFNQDYTSYSRKFWGGGLGLTVSAHLVHLAGGAIGLASEPGHGAEFWFTWQFKVPITAAAPQPQPVNLEPKSIEETSSKFMLDGARVLLAEDEPISRILIETLLEQAGLKVDTVDNGRLAVERAAKGDYQAVLMDVQMPVMDGLEATVEIRNNERLKGGHLPIIALTAHAMHGDREKCLQAGMDDYLTKPLNKNNLFEVLTRFLTSTALVVDGNPDSQQKVVEYLIESGWRVTIAESGRSAMYEASLAHFDLIVLDTEMTEADGGETARIIRRLEEYSGRHATIIGIADGNSGDDLVKRSQEGGVDTILRRPLELEELENIIR
ncbi:MAG: response regulator [Desulfobulbaceae bacterium]|nr:MAG: response regulator [Desulfobulbaceae bacterium]